MTGKVLYLTINSFHLQRNKTFFATKPVLRVHILTNADFVTLIRFHHKVSALLKIVVF